jgi:hypothetical protein
MLCDLTIAYRRASFGTMASTCAFSVSFRPPERALLIREPYVSLILAHRKRWELRGMTTNIRGRIGLIRSGSGLVIGECKITDCLGPLDFETLRRTPNLSSEEHRELLLDGKAPYLLKDGRTSKTYAWVVDHPIVYSTPLPYKHPSGAIIFVDLTKPGVLECSEALLSIERQPQLF